MTKQHYLIYALALSTGAISLQAAPKNASAPKTKTAPKAQAKAAPKSQPAAKSASTKPVIAKPKPTTTAPTNIIFDGEETPAIKDLRDALQGYKAGEIKFEKTELGERTGQEFYLARRNEKTYIKYTVPTSLENAIYTLLGQWGFHWYGPGENWFVKPTAIPGDDIAGAWVRPTFRNRGFFGTGGLDFPQPTPRAFDPTNSYKTDWYIWKRRNRYNADFRGSGHAGQAFYLENKVLLDAHPEWFNSEAGKKNGRLKIEIPEAVAAYKAWVKKRHGTSSETFIDIGVDPEDGRGGGDDPLPSDGFAGITKWNHADKWWWLANEVAKEYSETDKHIVVSMYAYGDGSTNALAPKFPLRKNVYPVIIPYAFQTAYLPQEMVKVWAGKINGTMGLYDYWNITQWSQGLPQFHLHGLKNKLKFWHENKVDGVYNETTDAAGPMGHGHWLAGQLQFDLNKDFSALYQQYLNDCFGKGAPAMKRMYDRWSNNNQGAGEVNLSLADLKEADAAVEKGSPEWKRINEMKAYVHFMKMYHDHDGTQESKDRLFEYLYSIHHLFMVQTAAFMGQHYISPLDKGNIIPVGTDKRLTEAEIDAQFRQDLISNPKLYDVSNFQFDFSKAKYSVPIAPNSWRFGRSTNAYIVPQKSETISFDVGSEANTQLTIFTDDGIILQQSVGADNFDYDEAISGRTWRMKKQTLKVEAGKTYHIRLRGAFNRLKMNSDVIVYNSHGGDDFDNYAYPVQYVYVPKNCQEIVFSDNGAKGEESSGSFFLPGNSGPITPENRGKAIGIKGLYRLAVKPEWRGRVLAFSFGHTMWGFKNIPNVIAMQEFEYQE